jgi:head-tail adaptor
MLPGMIANQTVVRLRGVNATDEYGNQITDWTTPDQAAIAGCSMQPETAAEYTDTREEVLSRWRLWAPNTADITHTDRILAVGETSIVDGSVQTWSQLGLAHTTCLLRLLAEA